eukprot:TRINITY_DN6592_c0_g1_i1.p1 TRINITY_DN6592_c0_g1~~TRINITY_DN6592_c0_g1_i1.p1  ORF type:complete len:283 (-),score=67.94 TRINITY_DN6592_c0_g1_i1:12-860(-)
MNREWAKIDRLRLDKYYSLMRYFLNETISVIKLNEWNIDIAEKHAQVLIEGPLANIPGTQLGILYHLCDTYLPEIRRVHAGPLFTINPKVILVLLEPFFHYLSFSKTVPLQRIMKEILIVIVEDWSAALAAESGEYTDEEVQIIQLLYAHVVEISERMFILASSPDTKNGNRDQIYLIQEQFENMKKFIETLFGVDDEGNSLEESGEEVEYTTKVSDTVNTQDPPVKIKDDNEVPLETNNQTKEGKTGAKSNESENKNTRKRRKRKRKKNKNNANKKRKVDS